MMSITHGCYPKDELVPLAFLYRAKSGTGNLWGRLTQTMRVFVFPGVTGVKKPRLALLNREAGTFGVLCDLDQSGEEYTGMVGLGWLKIKKNPEVDNKPASWSLYFSATYGRRNEKQPETV
jgi:hypothetical protein